MQERWLVDSKSAERQYVIKWKDRPLKPGLWSIADHNDKVDLVKKPAIKRKWRGKMAREDVPWCMGKPKSKKAKSILDEAKATAMNNRDW